MKAFVSFPANLAPGDWHLVSILDGRTICGLEVSDPVVHYEPAGEPAERVCRRCTHSVRVHKHAPNGKIWYEEGRCSICPHYPYPRVEAWLYQDSVEEFSPGVLLPSLPPQAGA